MRWDRNYTSDSGRIAIDGSLRGIVNRYAARGWAVVQMDLVGGMTLWYGVWRICAEVHRTIKRVDIRAFYMALCKLCVSG